MKHRSAARQPWPRVLTRRFTHQRIESNIFTGHVTLLCMDRVNEPLVVDWQGTPLCVCDSGFSWLQQFPDEAHHAVTTQFDTEGNVVQWYIDVCNRHALDADGIPWWEDLYLDVLVVPDGRVEIVDADELEEALAGGVIDRAQYELAWREARALVTTINEERLPLLQLAHEHRQQLLRHC